MVDHTILLNKLSHYGIRGKAYNWLSSYLNNRTQYVNVNGSNSTTKNLKFGVPQGSILGPLLFIIYINDLPNSARDAHFIMYADDANIIITGANISEIQFKANNLLRTLSNWVNINSLKLNLKKTHYMIFSNIGKFSINLQLENNVISQSHQERFLGVIMDDKLTWNSHRAAIAKKISINAGIFFRARHMFKLSTLRTLYHSFIQSHLIFCLTVWGTGTKSSLKKKFIAQKKAIRALTFTNLYTKDKVTQQYSYGHTKQHFNSNDILTIHNLVLAHVLLHLHKIYLQRAPSHIQSMYISHNPPIVKYSDDNNQFNITDHNKKLLKSDIRPNNILYTKDSSILYFTVPQGRLCPQRSSLPYLGPLSYNYFCNKTQLKLDLLPTKYEIHRLTPNCFKTHIKKLILSEQSLGEISSWEPKNMPIYSIPTNTILLRSHIY